MCIRSIAVTVAFGLLVGVPASAQETVPVERYAEWETLGSGTTIAPNGEWVAYQIRRVNEEHELRVSSTRRDTTLALSYASSPVFSDDSRWLAYAIGVSPDEQQRLRKAEEPVRDSLGLRDLTTGELETFGAVATFAFSRDSRYLAYRRYAPEDRSAGDLIVRDLATGVATNFGNVDTYAWSDALPSLAMTIRTEAGAGNGVHVYTPATGALRVLASSDRLFRQLAWQEDADQLAVLEAIPDSTFADSTHVIRLWRGLATEDPVAFQMDPSRQTGFPAELRVAEHRSLSWSDDGASLYFGLRPRDVRPSEPDSAEGDREKTSDVQIWHARDFRIIPMQRAQEQRDLQRTMLGVWHVDDRRVVQLGTDLMERGDVLAGDRAAFETGSTPYAFEEMFGRVYDDVYVTDVRTGARKRALERIRHLYPNSSTGGYLLYFLDEDFWVYDVAADTRRNLTVGSGATFVNRDYDHPVEQYPPYGVAGWTIDDRAVWLYDKYDVWSVNLQDGAATRLTNGSEEDVIHRRVRLDPDEDAIDDQTPQYFRITGDRSKRSGYARRRADGRVERLVWEDASVGRLARAKLVETFVFSRERFDFSPELLAADAALSAEHRLAKTNAAQGEYAWGRGELVAYTSQAGHELQGALFYPANHDPSRRYPMIVYQYEILSTRLHSYVGLSERSYYNRAVWTQNGYFVLLPDIVYRGRDPGRSAVEAIEPAVQAVLDLGVVDPERVGLIGHSWGGYQATFVPTQTDIFAASVAGAPLTNFLSMMGAIHWRPGLPETGHWETGQARMEVPFWEDVDAHVRNSPAAFVHQLETPMLMMFGDADGTVDWRQGVEFYNYARRAGKDDFVMLVYPGEDHGLREKENQIDYHRRILQWFGHYLKGDPAPGWMTEGISFIDRKKDIANGGGGRR